MILGLFLAIGESFADFKKKGQDELLIRYNLKTYSENFDKVYVFSYGNESLTFFKNVYVLPNKYRLNRFLYSLLLPLFYPKIILSCNVFRGLQITGGLPGILVKLLFRKKIVINYGYFYQQVALIEGKKIQAFLYKLSERIILPISDVVIATTPDLKNYVSRFSKRVVLVPNGVDTKLFKPLKNVKKKYSVIYVGRLEKQKNLPVLIKTISLLDKNDKKILMIGEGSLKKFLLSQAKEKKVNLKIQNKVPHHLLPKYYNQAKIFVLPSFIEGHPKTLIETMSCGLPVIGNDVPGINSVIQDEKNGLLFKQTAESLRKKIDLLLENRDLRKKLGANARKFVLKNYNYLDLKQKEINVLKNNDKSICRSKPRTHKFSQCQIDVGPTDRTFWVRGKGVKEIWKKWKELSIRAASFQGRVILTILFFTALAPVGIYFLLKKDKKKKTLWQDKDLRDVRDLEGLRRQ